MMQGWRRQRVRPALLALAMLLAVPASPARAVVVLFSDFESVTSPDFRRQGYAMLRQAEGWTGGAAGMEVQTGNVAGRAFSGRNLVELDSTRNSSMWVDLPKGNYTVSYWYSPRPDVDAASNAITLSSGSRLLDMVTGQGGRQTLWQQRKVAFRSNGDRLTFAADGRSDSLGGYLDDITVSMGAVPELATWAMLIIGFGMVGMAARRRRRIVTV
jgi:hypothetical protein